MCHTVPRIVRGEIRGGKTVCEARSNEDGETGERGMKARADSETLTLRSYSLFRKEPFQRYFLCLAKHTGASPATRDRARVRSASFCLFRAFLSSSAARQIRLRIVSSRSLILSTGFKRMEHRVSLVEVPSTVSAGNGLPMPG